MICIYHRSCVSNLAISATPKVNIQKHETADYNKYYSYAHVQSFIVFPCKLNCSELTLIHHYKTFWTFHYYMLCTCHNVYTHTLQNLQERCTRTWQNLNKHSQKVFIVKFSSISLSPFTKVTIHPSLYKL